MTSPETLSSLFASPATYWVPPYQRAYSWEEKHVAQFLEDVRDHKPGKPYYLGHFLFERKAGPVEQDSEELYVIDGQQRLTTVVLFMGCVCRTLEERKLTVQAKSLREKFLEREHAFRFHAVAPDHDVFKDLVEKGCCGLALEQQSRSQQRMQVACDYLWGHLSAAKTEDILSWVAGVAEAHVSQMTVVDKVQATQIFTLQNSRGKDLTNLEELKAWLMHQVYLHSEKNGENEAIASVEEQFKTIYQTAELLRHLTEDQVLQHHTTAFHPRPDRSAMENLADEAKGRFGMEVVRHIIEFCKALAATFRHVQSLEKLLKDHEVLADLVILAAADSWPLLIKLHSMHGPEIVRSPVIVKLLRDAETTLVKFHFLHGNSANYLRHFAAKLGSDPVHDLNWLAGELEVASTHGFRRNRDFADGFVRFLNSRSHYNYDHKMTRYILWKHENKMRETTDVMITPAEFLNTRDDARMKFTLEHLEPVTPREGAHTLEFIDQCLHNIGNLLLMPQAMNASQNNRAVEAKALVMRNTTHAAHRGVANALREPCGTEGCAAEWCAHKIFKRQETMVAFAKKRWRVEAAAGTIVEPPGFNDDTDDLLASVTAPTS